MNNFKIGDKIERISGDARNRGVIVELDEEKQRARINWTHRQLYEIKMVSKYSYRTKTNWFGEFEPYLEKQPRTWTAFKSIVKVSK